MAETRTEDATDPQVPESVGPAREWSWTYAGFVLFAAAVFLWSIRSVLAPVPLYLLLLLMLSPYAGDYRHRVAVGGATLLFGIWVLDELGGLLTPFLLAIAIAYILDPAVDFLQRRRVHRDLAIAILALPALALLAALFLFGVPALARQLDTLFNGLPAAIERLGAWLETTREHLLATDLPLVDEERFFGWIRSLDQERIVAFLEQRQEGMLEGTWTALLGVGRGVGVVLGVLGYVVLTPILSIYLLRDWDRMTTAAAGLIPQARRERWLGFIREYDALLARFLRGQVTAAAIVGVLTWAGLMIVGFPLAGLVGAIAGVFNLVPYLGLVASVIPVVIIALISDGVLGLLLRAGIVFAIVQFIDGSITGPRIVGGSVGLHPVWVILALAVGGFAFGFAGLLLAMPAAVLVKLLLREAFMRYRRSALFGTMPDRP